jgi:hypothetical protein
MMDRLLKPPLAGHCICQVIVSLGILWLDPQDFGVMTAGLLEFPLTLQDISQVVVGLG